MDNSPHCRNEYGLLEAMIMAGHRNITTTKRYKTIQYDDLLEQLKSMHSMEHF
ncbi:MAG: hypothetical protein K8R85_10480 [Bacteroidetes bacterium]|nr:hypothetical protein [Bacteroidota bacterium]